MIKRHIDYVKAGKRSYQQYRRELFATPELRAIYQEEALKKEAELRLFEQSPNFTQKEQREAILKLDEIVQKARANMPEIDMDKLRDIIDREVAAMRANRKKKAKANQ